MPVVQASLLRDVGERAISVVVVKGVSVNSCNKNVGMSIVVVIPDGDSNVKPGALQSSLFRYVGEDTVAIVTVKAIPVLGVVLFPGCEGSAVGKEDVGSSIPVVVENSDSPGHGLWSVA